MSKVQLLNASGNTSGTGGDGWKLRWSEKQLEDVTDLITCGVAKRLNYVEKGIPFCLLKISKMGSYGEAAIVDKDIELSIFRQPEIN